MVSILRRHKVLSCVLKLYYDHGLLIELNDLIILTISSTQYSKDESLNWISRFFLTGTVLLLDIRLHYLVKKILKRFDFSKKVVWKLPRGKNKKVIGLMKQELGEKILTKFAR